MNRLSTIALMLALSLVALGCAEWKKGGGIYPEELKETQEDTLTFIFEHDYTKLRTEGAKNLNTVTFSWENRYYLHPGFFVRQKQGDSKLYLEEYPDSYHHWRLIAGEEPREMLLLNPVTTIVSNHEFEVMGNTLVGVFKHDSDEVVALMLTIEFSGSTALWWVEEVPIE